MCVPLSLCLSVYVSLSPLSDVVPSTPVGDTKFCCHPLTEAPTSFFLCVFTARAGRWLGRDDGGQHNGRTVRLPQPGKKTPTISHKPAIDRFVPTHRSIVGVFSSRSGTGFRTRPGTSSVRYWWSIRRAG